MNRQMQISENECRTIIAVFSELGKMPYDKVNTFLGSITIEEMQALLAKARKWYHENDASDFMDEQ